jgi:hypothetical protein
MVAGSGAWLLRGDPIRAAQRAARAKPGGDRLTKGSGSDPHARARRAGKKRKNDDDDEDDQRTTRRPKKR